MKSNDLSPTKGSLYKGMGTDREGFFFFFLVLRGRKGEKATHGKKLRERERERERE